MADNRDIELNKRHLTHERSYQIRVDGMPVYYLNSIDKLALDHYLRLCEKHHNSYVDIVRINTEIIMSQSEYHQMKRHFDHTTQQDK